MRSLICGNVEIPFCFVQSISWTKRAKTVQHVGGYVSSRGFESAEISVKAHFDYATSNAIGIDAKSIYTGLVNLTTDRLSPSGVLYLDTHPIYPELEFTPTNINKTFVTDESGSEIIELDIIFSGVKAVKEVNRENVLRLEPVTTIPEVVLSVDGKELVVQDSCAISAFTTTPDSVSLSFEIGSDTEIVSRDGFLTKLLNGGIIQASLPQGETKYYVITADLVDNELVLTGSVLPPKSQQAICKTYQNTTLKAIIQDLTSLAGVECNCLIDGKVDYYRAFGAPIQCIRDLQASAGFVMSWRHGVLTCADVPDNLSASLELQYISITQDGGDEPISGIYWTDGITRATVGDLDNTSLMIYSVFRSVDGLDYARECFSFAKYNHNHIIVSMNIMDNLDNHSVVYVRSNGQDLSCMAEWIEFDWINNIMQVELHYPG